MLAARAHVRGPQRPPVRSGDDLHVAAVTSEERTRDRYTIRSYVSTAVKHGRNTLAELREAMLDRPWTPSLPSPT